MLSLVKILFAVYLLHPVYGQDDASGSDSNPLQTSLLASIPKVLQQLNNTSGVDGDELQRLINGAVVSAPDPKLAILTTKLTVLPGTVAELPFCMAVFLNLNTLLTLGLCCSVVESLKSSGITVEAIQGASSFIPVDLSATTGVPLGAGISPGPQPAPTIVRRGITSTEVPSTYEFLYTPANGNIKIRDDICKITVDSAFPATVTTATIIPANEALATGTSLSIVSFGTRTFPPSVTDIAVINQLSGTMPTVAKTQCDSLNYQDIGVSTAAVPVDYLDAQRVCLRGGVSPCGVFGSPLAKSDGSVAAFASLGGCSTSIPTVATNLANYNSFITGATTGITAPQVQLPAGIVLPFTLPYTLPFTFPFTFAPTTVGTTDTTATGATNAPTAGSSPTSMYSLILTVSMILITISLLH